jgi:hypothetical protein
MLPHVVFPKIWALVGFFVFRCNDQHLLLDSEKKGNLPPPATYPFVLDRQGIKENNGCVAIHERYMLPHVVFPKIWALVGFFVFRCNDQHLLLDSETYTLLIKSVIRYSEIGLLTIAIPINPYLPWGMILIPPEAPGSLHFGPLEQAMMVLIIVGMVSDPATTGTSSILTPGITLEPLAEEAHCSWPSPPWLKSVIRYSEIGCNSEQTNFWIPYNTF